MYGVNYESDLQDLESQHLMDDLSLEDAAAFAAQMNAENFLETGDRSVVADFCLALSSTEQP